jgi:hypothetical protein
MLSVYHAVGVRLLLKLKEEKEKMARIVDTASLG